MIIISGKDLLWGLWLDYRSQDIAEKLSFSDWHNQDEIRKIQIDAKYQVNDDLTEWKKIK